MPLTPSQRALRSRLAAHALHKNILDELAHTEPARRAANARFEHEVDPDGQLDPRTRARLAAHARREHMLRLALRSAKKRRARKGDR